MKKSKLSYYFKKNISLVILVSILGLLFLGTVAVTLLSQRSQELRQQAAQDQGLVVVSTQAASNEATIGQPTQIDFAVNTNDVQIDGIQLLFTINGTIDTSSVDFTLTNSSLQAAVKNIQDIGNGQHAVQLLIISSVTGQPFSTSTDTNFGQLVLTPTQAGAVSLDFDQSGSKATVYLSNPVRDELRTLTAFNLSVVPPATDTPTPTPTSESTATPTPSPTPTSSAQATNTPTPTPTPNDGVGGTAKQCNETCSTNADCDINLTCQQNRCRLATNVSSETCQPAADQGIHRSCNEYCANSTECNTGLTCYYNKCRNPQNVTSSTCQAASQTTNTNSNNYSGSSLVTGGSTKTPTPRPTSKTSTSPSPSTNIGATTQNNVFGNTPGSGTTSPVSSSIPAATPLAETTTPVPTPEEKSNDQNSLLSKLPQILLIAAIISLPILFIAPMLLGKLAASRNNGSHPVVKTGLEHKLKNTSLPKPMKKSTTPSLESSPSPKPTPKAGDHDMKTFAGVTPPETNSDEK